MNPKEINITLHYNLNPSVWSFFQKEGLKNITKSEYVVSKISDATYGVVYFADDKIVFCKHKAIEINKGKKLPRICTEIQITCKFITQEDYDTYFRMSNSTEILYLEMQEEKNLFN